MSGRKKLVLIIVTIGLVASVIGWKLVTGNKAKYNLERVSTQTLTEVVTESGNVTTSNRINIFSPTNGVVEKIWITNGESIAEGQKLFRVKSTATDSEKTIAWAAYQDAMANVQMAENNRRLSQATVDRVHDDLKDHNKDETYLQKEARTTAEVSHDNAYDTLVSAQAALASARTSYLATQNSTITSPVAGIISNLAVASGSAVNNNSTFPVVAVSGLGPSEITIYLGESDINKIQVGQTADIMFDAIDNKKYTGRVTRFDDQGTLNQGVIKFAVYVEILQPDSGIKPGMTADVTITTRTLTNALVVPNAAVKPYQKGRAIRKLKGGKVYYIPVEIGLRGKEKTQILTGLKEGEEIVVALPSEQKKKNSIFSF